MITSNVWTRVFRLKYGDGYGTCFAIDVDDKEYLVTAKHLVAGISDSSTIEIFRQNEWHVLKVRLVGNAPGETDVTVLAGEAPLSPGFPLPPTLHGIAMYQDTFFLGFPYNLYMNTGESNYGFPIPFAKKALLSSSARDENGMNQLFLDGHNNPGFSGGPVVWTNAGDNKFNVGGIISGYRFQNEPVYAGEELTPLVYRYNTGIIIAYGIDIALRLIQDNPIGTPRRPSNPSS